MKCLCGCGEDCKRTYVRGHNARGAKFTKERRENISNALKGNVPWNKGTKGVMVPWNKGLKGVQTAWNKGKPWPEETIKKMSESQLGWLENNPHPMLGVKFSDESLERLSLSHMGQQPNSGNFKKGQLTGSENFNWNGGTSFEPYDKEFNEKLKEEIRNRDNNSYRRCGKTQEEEGKNLCVHHIDHNKKNSSRDNLVTVCNLCNLYYSHHRVESILSFSKKIKKML